MDIIPAAKGLHNQVVFPVKYDFEDGKGISNLRITMPENLFTFDKKQMKSKSSDATVYLTEEIKKLVLNEYVSSGKISPSESKKIKFKMINFPDHDEHFVINDLKEVRVTKTDLTINIQYIGIKEKR